MNFFELLKFYWQFLITKNFKSSNWIDINVDWFAYRLRVRLFFRDFRLADGDLENINIILIIYWFID